MTQDTLQVTEAAPAAQGIQSFELRHPQGLPLQPFSAGSHLRVKTPSGMLRQYSLCNDPAETDRYRIAVKREDSGRGGSASMVDQLQPGDLLEVGLPENQFALDDRASRFLLIAGGIGITPMLSMAYQLNSEGRPYQLIYLSRDAQSTAFLEELRGPEFAGKVKVHHDQGDPARALDLWPLLEKPGSAWTYGYIIWLGVAPGGGRRGVGAKLVKELQDIFIELGARMIMADTDADNSAAISFFAKQGFAEDSEHVYLSKNLTYDPAYIAHHRKGRVAARPGGVRGAYRRAAANKNKGIDGGQ